MLPRHLRSAIVTRASPAQIRALPWRQNALKSTSPRALTASFHSSSRRQDEAPKSPFKVFADTLREEIQKNRELDENYKQLKGDVGKIQDLEAFQKARAAYERARLISSIQENPKLRAAAEELKKTGVKVSDAVGEALKSMEESEVLRAISRATSTVSSTIASTTEPIRNTAAYKTLSETLVDALDDSGSAKHAGFEEKEARRARRAARLAKLGKESFTGKYRIKADPEASGAIVLHKDSPRRERWERLKETNPVLRSLGELKQAYDESENPVVSSMRSVTQTIGSWFDETEHAKVHRMMKAMDPMFSVEHFERELREYIVPEVVDAFLSADREALQAWCSEATFNVLWATMEVYLKQGLVSESKVLDIRQVDVRTGEILENDVAAFLISFTTQETLIFRNVLTREIVVGAEDRVEQCHYGAVITRAEEELDNELTGGWKVIQMQRRSSRVYL